MKTLLAVAEQLWKIHPEEITIWDVDGTPTIVIHDQPATHYTYWQLDKNYIHAGFPRDAIAYMDETLEEALRRHREPFWRLLPIAGHMAPAGDSMAYLSGI